MARLVGPDEGHRLVYINSGPDEGKALAQDMSAPIWADAALTVPANILSLDNQVIPGNPPTLVVDQYSKIPQFKYPDGVHTVYTKIGDGPVIPLHASTDERLDSLSVDIATTGTTAAADATTKANAARDFAIQRGNHAGVQAMDTITGLSTSLANKADLVGGVVPNSQIPSIALVDFLGTPGSQAAMLALTGQKGDWAIRTDRGTTWQITGSDPTQLSSWVEHATPADAVSSVNGATGAVVLGKASVGLANVDDTSDTNKPISAATATALAGKSAIPPFTGERVFFCDFGSAANEKIDLYFSAAYAVAFEIDMVGVAANGNGSGTAKVVYSLAVNGATALENNMTVLVAHGPLLDHFTLSPARYDVTNSRWRITVAHLQATDNDVTLRVRWQTNMYQDWSNEIRDSIAITPVYIDATAFPALTSRATTTVPGTVQLAGDFAGTALAPRVADGAITSAKIADAAITTGDIADSAITSAKIADGTIVDADVSDSAAIAQTKISNLPTSLSAKADKTAYTGERAFDCEFPGGASNQKIDLHVSGFMISTFEVTLTGTANAGDATGTIRALYSFVGSDTGAVITNSMTYLDVQGKIGRHFGLMEPRWDAANSRWRISVVHRTNTANSVSLYVKWQGNTTAVSTAIENSIGISPVYTTDTATVNAPAGATIRVADYGIRPSETVDQTAALQSVIDSLPEIGSTSIVFDAGRYLITGINLGQRSISLIGVDPIHTDPARFSDVGGSPYKVAAAFRGTWLVSTVTAGEAVTMGTQGAYARLHRQSIKGIGICGPGAGTSIGLYVNDAVSPHIENVHVVNFDTGARFDFMQSGTVISLAAWGCKSDGILADGFTNQNTWINTDIQFNTRYGIRLEDTDENLFLGGVTEVNNGVPIKLGSLCRKAKFDSWYFEDPQETWPAPITWVVDVDGGENTFEDCRFIGPGNIRFSGNNNNLLNPYTVPSVTLNGQRNLLVGGSWDDSTITEATPNTNTIITHQEAQFMGDVNASRIEARGSVGANLPARLVGGTVSGPPVSGTHALRDVVVATDGTVWVCTAAGDPGTWKKQVAGSVATSDITDGAVTSAKIAEGTIVDADISDSAAIAQTKVSGLGATLLGKQRNQGLYVATDPQWGYTSGVNLTAACQAAIDAMPSSGAAKGGTLVIPPGNWDFPTPVVLKGGVRVTGAGGRLASRINGRSGGIFTWASHISDVIIDHLNLVNYSGHMFTNSGGDWSIYTTKVQNCNLTQIDVNGSIMRHVGASDYDNVDFEQCYFTRTTGATVPGIHIVNTGGAANENRIRDCWAHSNNCNTSPMFYIESTSNENYAYDWVIENITGEQNAGGILEMRAVYNPIISNVQDYDTQVPYTSDIIKITKSNVIGGLLSVNPRVVSSGRRDNATLPGGVYDINMPPGTVRRGEILNPNHSNTGLRLNFSPNEVTVINAPEGAWVGQESGIAHSFRGQATFAGSIAAVVPPFTGERVFFCDFGSAANEKIDLYFSAAYAVAFEIDMVGIAANGDASGTTKVVYSLATNGASAIENNMTCLVAHGPLLDHFTLSPARYDAINGRWRITVAHLQASNNDVTLRVRWQTNLYQDWSNEIRDSIAITPVYIDATAFSKLTPRAQQSLSIIPGPASGPPTTGTYEVGALALSGQGKFYINTTAGSPGVFTTSAEVVNLKTDCGAVGNGTADDTEAIRKAFAACMIGGANPVNSVRLGVKALYVPQGDYRVTSPIDLLSVQGFHMFGERIGTRFLVSGNLSSVFNLQGVAYSEFKDFDIAARIIGTDTVTSAISLDWDPALAARSSTSNTFRHVAVRDLKYVNAFAFGLNSGSRQVDQVDVQKCEAIGAWTPGETAWWQNGYVSGSGIHGNPLNHNYISAIANANRYNIFANAVNTYWWGGSLGFAEADFKQLGAYPLSIEAFRTEHSQRLLVQVGGAGFLSNVSIRDVLFDAVSLAADGQIIRMGYPGELSIDNFIVQENGSNPTIHYSSAQSRKLAVTVRSSRTRTAPESFVTSSHATLAPLSVKLKQYTQTDETGAPVSVTPEYPYPTSLTKQLITTVGNTDVVVPAQCKEISWCLVGSTAGAGSGARGASGTALAGGGSAGGAGFSMGSRPATGNCAPGSTLTVTIGAGGTGGAAITTDDTAGNAGTAGQTTQIAAGSETFALALCGPGGGGGGLGSAGSAGGNGEGIFAGSAGIASSGAGAPQSTSQNSRGGGPGGGPGGGITAAGVASNGGASGSNMGYRLNQGSGGVVDGAAPTTGLAPSFTVAGAAGAGGAGSITTAAQAGANAGLGGGAGGGGASLNGNPSGKGGDGHRGEVEITFTF